MSRRFEIVERKIVESEFFICKLEEALATTVFWQDPQFYLSAFISATRSITFTIQASISDIDGFTTWYKVHQEQLSKNKLARYFLEARNLSQKIGYYLIGGSSSHTNENGQEEEKFHFQTFNTNVIDVPDDDVITGCEKYFTTLLEVVSDCYKVFGNQIYPERFYTYENLLLTKKTIEDFEEQAGYPKGWTAASGLTIQDRLDLILRGHPKCTIDRIFEKYLGTNRFGETEEN